MRAALLVGLVGLAVGGAAGWLGHGTTTKTKTVVRLRSYPPREKSNGLGGGIDSLGGGNLGGGIDSGP
jgi:hypothetical protein